MPLRADSVRAIRTDADLWEAAVEQPPFSGPWGDEPLPQISLEMLAMLPSGSGWVDHFDGRCFGQAEYLLDPVAYRDRSRTWAQREQSAAYRTVFGAERFAEHATSGQGVSWRCSGSAFLTAAAQRINEFDVVTSRREFSVAEMVDLGVYKVHRDEDDDKAFAAVLAQLRGFGDRCRAVAAQDLDLIIELF